MTSALVYELHKLTARLDRAADHLLEQSEGISYPRFLTLLAVRHSAGTQRELARWLGVTEASTSRMVGVLVKGGLLTAHSVSGFGNRRQLALTAAGGALVDRATRLLDEEFARLVGRSGVAYDEYQRDTRCLLTELDRIEHGAMHEAVAQ